MKTVPAHQVIEDISEGRLREHVLFLMEDPSLMLWIRRRFRVSRSILEVYLDNPTPMKLLNELEQADFFYKRKAVFVNGFDASGEVPKTLRSSFEPHIVHVVATKNHKVFSDFDVVAYPSKKKHWIALLDSISTVARVKLTEDAYEYLSQDRGIAFAISEIEKVSLVYDRFDRRAIRDLGVTMNNASALPVIDACLLRRQDLIGREVADALKQFSSIQIVELLLSTLQDLIVVTSLTSTNGVMPDLAEKAQISYYRARVLVAAQTRFTSRDLVDIYEQLVDLAAKLRQGFPDAALVVELSRIFGA